MKSKARQPSKEEIIKKAIIAIAEKKGYSRKLYWKVDNFEIRDWIDDRYKVVNLHVLAIIRLRKKLPRQYRTKKVK